MDGWIVCFFGVGQDRAEVIGAGCAGWGGAKEGVYRNWRDMIIDGLNLGVDGLTDGQ